MELPNIAAYAYQDVHVWSALLTCLRPYGGCGLFVDAPPPPPHTHTPAALWDMIRRTPIRSTLSAAPDERGGV